MPSEVELGVLSSIHLWHKITCFKGLTDQIYCFWWQSGFQLCLRPPCSYTCYHQHVHKSITNLWVCLAEYATFQEKKKTIFFPFPDEGMIQKLAGKKMHQECPACQQSTREWQVDIMLRHTSWTDATLRWRSWCKVGVLVIRSQNFVLLRKLICLHRGCVAAGWSHQSEGRNA